MNTRKSDERKPALYYATLSIMLVAFTFTAAQANAEELAQMNAVEAAHSTTVCDHQVCQELMLAASR